LIAKSNALAHTHNKEEYELHGRSSHSLIGG